MGLLSLFLTAALSLPGNAASWDDSWKGLPQLMRVLETVPEGKSVLEKAAAHDPHFAEKIRKGSASYTESTFTRTFSLLDGGEKISLRHEVTLNQELSLADAAVDLAHELVHYTQKEMLDPYQPGFEIQRFIRNGIEGPGGELDALRVECRTAWALQNQFAHFPLHRLCERYRKTGDAFDEAAARRDYYAVGGIEEKSFKRLRAFLPELNSHAPIFTSSYAQKPYPVALAEEYDLTQRTACANNRRKYQLIASQSTRARRLASAALQVESLRLRDYERRFCRAVTRSSGAVELPARP